MGASSRDWNSLRIVLFAAVLWLSHPVGSLANSVAETGPAVQNGFLETYNHLTFAFNRYIYSYFTETTSGSEPVPTVPSPAPNNATTPDAVQSGFGPALSNLINEPITVASSLLVGDVSTAWNAMSRFGINSTYGVLGWWDKASTMGYKPTVADLGLSLCRIGVGEGGYIVLPFVGPRTVRDAVVDIILVNALLWTTSGFVFNSGVSVQTVAIAETIEIGADIIATRQIDPKAKKLDYTDFDEMRQQYLQQRRERCKV